MRTRHKLTLFLLCDFSMLLLLKTTHSEDVQEMLRKKSWQKRQVLSFPFLPGHVASGPGKGKRLLMVGGPRDLVPAAGKGASVHLWEDRREQGGFQRDPRIF